MRMLQTKQTFSAISFHPIKAPFSSPCPLWNPKEFQHPAAESHWQVPVAPGTKHSCPFSRWPVTFPALPSLISICSLAPLLSDCSQGKAHGREAVLRKTEDLVGLMYLSSVFTLMPSASCSWSHKWISFLWVLFLTARHISSFQTPNKERAVVTFSLSSSEQKKAWVRAGK